MATAARLLLLLFLTAAASAWEMNIRLPTEMLNGGEAVVAPIIHALRPLLGSGGQLAARAGVACDSWRLGVEAHNVIGWKTVPARERAGAAGDEAVVPAAAPARRQAGVLTGRTEDQRNITVTNLRRQGYSGWMELLLKPAVHAAGELQGSAVAYKSGERQKLEDAGFTILGNIGDQWSDILGTPEGARTFKLPDPMYYIG
ncbi:hypothetical protein OsJ_17413 [Oryza sativa Japonica Group]|uniref:Acid phosphatase n=1 Tax=Oryza sativa subsp. japonica TaxID=39947 RepID=B9FMW4_ORYSJ|nr:hypothetical protein OsJ_17413 [Oryza sativa Japonica Group]